MVAPVPVRVLHLITGLKLGGTEIQLLQLLTHMDPDMVHNRVVSLTAGGDVANQLHSAGIPLHDLGMTPGRPSLAGLFRLYRILRSDRPDVLQTWLYHADLLGLVAARLARTRTLAWNIRCSGMDKQFTTGVGRVLVRLLARMSNAPDVVMVNSEKGRAHHAEIGYRPRRWEKLNNGFDLDRFRPDPEARISVRRELGLGGDHALIGMLARRDPVKGHSNFLRAAAALGRRLPQSHFLLAGSGVDEHGPLAAEAAALGLAGRVAMLGPRDDIPRLTAALDVATCASSWEGFPNIVGEALACGVPVVTTDVGDAASIVGDCGIVVPPGDPKRLAQAWADLLAHSPTQRAALGSAGRSRIASRYEIRSAAEQYARLYRELANPPG